MDLRDAVEDAVLNRNKDATEKLVELATHFAGQSSLGTEEGYRMAR
ncbi:MAG: hypothetical protein CM1200mP9_02460 [Gammaproteobacteria bacterium]|nr:MAG: hypothetical protein CM1200mP9_02460 [Gammaproteobacteria bacterium]